MDQANSVYVCGQCGSAMVDTSIVEGVATCKVCSWSGSINDLILIGQKTGSPEEILRQLSLDIRQLLSKNVATEFIKLLIKWGFLGQRLDKNEIARYFGVVAKSIATGLIEARQELERERSMRS